jgi:hypothetical protein
MPFSDTALNAQAHLHRTAGPKEALSEGQLRNFG